MTRLSFHVPPAPAPKTGEGGMLARKGLTLSWEGAAPNASHARARTQVQPWLPAVTSLLGISHTTQNTPLLP